MSRRLIGYTPWEEMNTTIDGVDRMGVIALYYDDSSTITSISRTITLPNGTPAYLCIGTKVISIRNGAEFLMDDYGVLWPQPKTTLTDYGTKAWVHNKLVGLAYTPITLDPGETAHNIYTTSGVDEDDPVSLVVTKQAIEITSSQVSDLSTTIGDAITEFQTDTADHRYLRVGTGTAVSNGTDLDTLKTLGKYRNANASNGCRNMPLEVAGRPFTLTVENMYGNSRYKQTLWLGQALVVDRWYYRIMTNDTDWSDWFKVAGTSVPTDVPTP